MELEFQPGTVIFNQGDPSTHAFLIREGAVEIHDDRPGATDRITRRRAGEVFGEMSLIEDRTHLTTAKAATAVRLTGVTQNDFQSLLNSDPASCRVYVDCLFDRLKQLSAEVNGPIPKPLPPSFVSPTVSAISVRIFPLTPDAATALPKEGLEISSFPFRIGRSAAEKERTTPVLNDLWLLDKRPFNISRNHVQFNCDEDNVTIQDRGSSLGIYVDDVSIGSKAARQEIVLGDGDHIIVLGGRTSPFKFRVSVKHPVSNMRDTKASNGHPSAVAVAANPVS